MSGVLSRTSLVIGGFIAVLTMWSASPVSAAEEEVVCTYATSNHTPEPNPTVEPLVPQETTRYPTEANCCPPPEHNTCQVKHKPVILKVHWEVTGSTECRAGYKWLGGSCQTNACFGVFAYITDPPGSKGDTNGAPFDWQIPCKQRVQQFFAYTQKKVSTEAFHYVGECKIGDVLKERVETDCIRSKTEKIENPTTSIPNDCTNDPACQ